MKSQSVLGETGELFKTEYNYDRTGNLKSRNDSINGKDEYYYDPVGRIKKNIDPMKRVKEFIHDRAGNYLKTEIKEEENSWKRVGTYDKISYEYDKAGNLIQRADTTFKWDSNNRLVTSQNNNIKTEYKYDPLGRRISKETEGKITNFYWEGNKLISDTERDYHYYPYSFEPLAMETQNKLYYYHNDINGAPLRLTDEKGRIVWNAHYNIFGKIDKLSKNEIDNPIRMQGQYEDEETGLYYNRYRYYDPNISAYVSQDPLKLIAGENLYTYVLNSFVWCDSLGLIVKYKINDSLTPLSGSRATAIDRAWVLEKELVNTTGEGTRNWSQSEIDLMNKTPNKNLTSVMSKAGYTGHHINSVEGNGIIGEKWKGDPRNITFLKNHNHSSGENEHVRSNQGHRGNTRNSTKGRLIDREATIKSSKKTCG